MKDQDLLFVHGMITVGCLRSQIASEKIQSLMPIAMTDQRKKIIIKRPASVELYNKFMGGVDKADMYLSLYRLKFRSQKWYHRIVTHFFNLAIRNSYVLYKDWRKWVFS